MHASRASGWAVEVADALQIALLKLRAAEMGLTPIQNRRGDDTVSVLTPTTAERAHPSSISAAVGIGQQPLHTDGAHHRQVPNYVLMWASTTNSTPTRIWSPWPSIKREDTSGMFVVHSGSDIFLAPAVVRRYLRYDPGCMTPADATARRLEQVLQAPPVDEVHDVHWHTPNTVLLLRNNVVLHGRAAVAQADVDRRLERMSFSEEDPS